MLLYDLVPFVQLKEREKHPWRSATFSWNSNKSSTRPWVFFAFFQLNKFTHIEISQVIYLVCKSIDRFLYVCNFDLKWVIGNSTKLFSSILRLICYTDIGMREITFLFCLKNSENLSVVGSIFSKVIDC